MPPVSSVTNRLIPQQLKKLNQAIEDCTSAIRLDDTYIKAYLRRAQWYVMQVVPCCSACCSFPLTLTSDPRSYMDTEQYEEAVRDYEKVYQTEKTSGTPRCLTLGRFCAWILKLGLRPCCSFRSQTSAEDGTDGAEKEQKKRLLQGAWGREERHRGRDQEGVPQAGPHAPPRYLESTLNSFKIKNIHDLKIFLMKSEVCVYIKPPQSTDCRVWDAVL